MIIPFILCFFLPRDFLLLTMGPAAKLSARLRLYAGVQLASELLFTIATLSLGTEEILQLITSQRVIVPLVLFYAMLAVLCIWVRRADRHHIAWLIAVAPNPLLVIGLAIDARSLMSGHVTWDIIGSSLLVSLWIAIVGFSVKAASHVPQDVRELDFSLMLAGLVNSIALLALPVESFLANTNG